MGLGLVPSCARKRSPASLQPVATCPVGFCASMRKKKGRVCQVPAAAHNVIPTPYLLLAIENLLLYYYSVLVLYF